MRYVIIPDVHGRDFWKQAVNDNIERNDTRIIFMGDYLDTYDFEHISNLHAINNFKQIIQLKKKYSEKITLLLGNHDVHYLKQFRHVYKSRYMINYYNEIQEMFEENFGLFDIASEIIDGTNRILLTHAGVTMGWIQGLRAKFEYEIERETDAKEAALKYRTDKFDCNWLNNLKQDENGMWLLWMIGRSRGGRGLSGSCIWADYYDHDYFDAQYIMEYTGYNYQIFSHSLASPMGVDSFELNDKFAMIDCRKAFVYENMKLKPLYDIEKDDEDL